MAYEGGGLSSLVCHLFGFIPDGWGNQKRPGVATMRLDRNMFYSMFCLKIVK